MQVPFDIDYVFPGVNNIDPVWKSTYENYCREHNETARLKELKQERFRDGGLLKYLLRGIHYCMPGIRKVHLIVSNKEQVPLGINQAEVNVVLHEQIMPQNILPTFNSTTIEMFLANIPDLAEHFIYGNDDMFPVRKTEPTDWFTVEGLPRCNMRSMDAAKIGGKQFRVVCAEQWGDLQEKITGKKDTLHYMRPFHGLTTMLKSECIEAQTLIGMDEIINSCSAFRRNDNINQYLYIDYLYLKGLLQRSDIEFTYTEAKKPYVLLETLAKHKCDIICLNDCQNDLTDKQLATLQILCAKTFDKIFPNKSKYEN